MKHPTTIMRAELAERGLVSPAVRVRSSKGPDGAWWTFVEAGGAHPARVRNHLPPALDEIADKYGLRDDGACSHWGAALIWPREAS